MKSGKCPKCNSKEVYKKAGRMHRSILAVSLFKQVKLEDYLCSKCGFTESYLLNIEDAKKIREKWQRAYY